MLFLLAAASLWAAPRFSAYLQSGNLIGPSELQPVRQPLPQDPFIQAYFNQSQANVYTDTYRGIQRHGDNLEQVIITAVDQANTSVDVAVQDFELPLIAEALIRSAERGVSTRIILENQYAQTAASSNAALSLLRGAAIPIIDDTADGSKGSGLMHHKFVVIDSQKVLTGSANFTYSGVHGDLEEPDSRGNANVLLKIENEAIAAQFAAEFNQMWGDGPGQKSDSKFGLQKRIPPPQRTQMPTGTLTLQFSPSSTAQPWENSTNGLIARTLGQAQNTIDLALFVFSDQNIANQIQTQAAQGTEVRLLIESQFLYRSYSEALDMLGIAIPDNRCKIEAANRPWQTPIETVGSPQLPLGDKLHHKFAIVDDAAVIIGSHNWSQAANSKNDEALLIIENPTVAAHFSREFKRLYSKAELGRTPKLQYKMQKAQQQCG